MGNDHPDTLASSNDLGTVLGRQGDLSEAVQLLRETLHAARRVLGSAHPRTLSSAHGTRFLLQSLQKMSPHTRQWWRRRVTEKGVAQIGHALADLSSCQNSELRRTGVFATMGEPGNGRDDERLGEAMD